MPEEDLRHKEEDNNNKSVRMTLAETTTGTRIKQQQVVVTDKVKIRFEGREPSLAGHIYDTPQEGERNPEQFIKTSKEIENFVGHTYREYTGEFVQAVKDLILNDPVAPAAPGAQPAEFEIWKLDIRDHRAKVKAYQNFKAGLYNTVFGQCTPGLQDRLKSHLLFDAADQDGIALLMIIKEIVYTFETRSNLADALTDVKEYFYKLKQGQRMPLQQYYELFTNAVGVSEEVGITIIDTALVDRIADLNGRANAPIDADRAEELGRTLAIRFIRGANAQHGRPYLTHLRNSYLDGYDIYPTSYQDAYNIMQRRQEAAPAGAQVLQGGGMAFVQEGEPALPDQEDGERPAPMDRHGREIVCFRCNQVGHYANECDNEPVRRREGNNFAQDVAQEHQRQPISRWWILLDNQSTVNYFCNEDLLHNVHESDEWMDLYSNGGTRSTKTIGTYSNIAEAWLDQGAITNILSLSLMTKMYQVYFDSEDGNKFVMVMDDGSVMEFLQSDRGLYYYDAEDDYRYHETRQEAIALVNTVADNKSSYTNADYLKAVRARKTQIKIGRPSTRQYLRIIGKNQLRNCPVTTTDIRAAEDIFGTDVGALQGKTTWRKPPTVQIERKGIPMSIHHRYRKVTLCADIMFINGIPFLLTISRNLKFGTVEEMSSRSSKNLIECMRNVVQKYAEGGFKVETALMDNEFEPLRGELAEEQIGLNITGRDEHVGDIERFVRTVKERVRCIYNTLPFERIPARLVIEMAKSAVFWLNAFPNDNGITSDISPRTIITGQTLNYNRHCKHEFSQYVQTHEEHDNGMGSRTVGALATRPTGNDQGNWYYMSLSTGRMLNRTRATPLPMPDDVIDRVHIIARRQKANPGLVFADRNRAAYVLDNEYDDDEDDDESYHTVDDDEYDYDYDDNEYDDNYEIDGHDDEDDNDNDDDHNPNVNDEAGDDNDGDDDDDDDDDEDYVDESSGSDDDIIDDIERGDIASDDTTILDESDTDADIDDDVPAREENAGVDTKIPGVDDEEIPGVEDEDDEGVAEAEALVEEMDRRYGTRTRTGLRERRRPRQYVHAQVAFKKEEESLATPQMSMKSGLKQFGEKGVAAIRSEMKQLHDREVLALRHKKDLTPEQRREALAYLTFLKRKRCGKVKGHGCADGRPQRQYISREDAASPTVATESVFLTTVIDALEGREVAVVDIPGAFMQADMDEKVHMRLDGKMAELLIEMDPEMYEPYVTYENGKTVLYVELLKALYGTMRAARLFWEKLSKQLIKWGYMINPYDPCVANKYINGKQCTVVWHVDDLKISHIDKTVVDNFIDQLDEEFGKETPLSKSRGKVHDYLGMVIDFSDPKQVTINMKAYVKMVLADIPDDMIGRAATPAANHLFTINDNPTYIDDEKAKIFHHITMQLMYLSQRGRPDIRTAVSFLSGRVRNPDTDDYRKLARVIKYLQSTIDLTLRLSSNGSNVMKWWVDASFAVHPDMKGHTGGTMSMGNGSIYSTSNKQKLVARSSTESELIGAYDVLPQIIWTQNFMKAQGHAVDDTILYQDNMSAMLLEKNGKALSGKRTRHINIRYFFIKDHVDSQTLRIEHCPTAIMLGDFFTKPLQGSLFRRMRDLLMNIDPDDVHHSDHRSVLKQEPRNCDPGIGNELELGIVNKPESGIRKEPEPRILYKDALTLRRVRCKGTEGKG